MTDAPLERRRHTRFPLGLPVGLRLAGRRTPLTVELLDVSESGARFHSADGEAEVHVADRAAFGFVVPGEPSCQAQGLVVRAEHSGRFAGQFVLALDGTNDAFVGFIRLLEADS
jgi:hypothetical protein